MNFHCGTAEQDLEALYFSCLMESKGNIFLLDEPVANVHPNRQNFSQGNFKRIPTVNYLSAPISLFNRSRRHSKISRLILMLIKRRPSSSSLEPMDPKTIEILGRTKQP